MTALDLSTSYLGLPLKNPLVVSASPLSKRVDLVRRVEDAGTSAVVMYSLFEEQIKRSVLSTGTCLLRPSEQLTILS
jgi:dihydroorotate dehydrogenase (fumarate)